MASIHKCETYLFTRVCFGNKPSPPIGGQSMVKMTYHGNETHPNASSALLFKRYIDDISVSCSDGKLLKLTRTEIDDNSASA